MKQWQTIMDAEEKRTGLRAGTLAALVKQETGGQQKFIDDPAAFHYKPGPKGEKPQSSARGLGGVLEGTARDPGYGVTPLKDWSVPEQLRFIADYAKARIKQAGSEEAGLAGYGEGGKYSQQVLARLGKPVKQSPLQLPDEAFAKQAPPPVEQALAVMSKVPDVQPVQEDTVPDVAPVQEQPMAAMESVMPRNKIVPDDLAFTIPVAPQAPVSLAPTTFSWLQNRNDMATKAKANFLKSILPNLVTG